MTNNISSSCESISPRPPLSPHHGWPAFFIPLDAAANPVHCLLYTCASQSTQRQDPTVSHAGSLLSLNHSAYQSFFDSDNFHAILSVLLVCQNEQGNALRLLVLQNRLKNNLALLQATYVYFCIPCSALFVDLLDIRIPNICAIDHKNDRVTAAVVVLPQAAQCVLSTHVPDLQVTLAEVYQADVLPNSRDGVQSCIVIRVVQALDLLEQCSLACIVEPKKEDGVFCKCNLSVTCTCDGNNVDMVGVELTLFACRMQVQRFGQMVHSPAHLCSRSLIALLL